MKRIGLSLLMIWLMMLLPQDLFPYDRGDFDRIVDFSVTIKTLNQNGERENPSFLDEGKLLLLNGTVSSLNFVNPDKEDFLMQMELVSGEWIGLEDVRSYRCHIIFKGPEFHRIFPSRLPKKPSSYMIGANDRILVAARALNQIQTEAGEAIWRLEGFHVRRIR